MRVELPELTAGHKKRLPFVVRFSGNICVPQHVRPPSTFPALIVLARIYIWICDVSPTTSPHPVINTSIKRLSIFYVDLMYKYKRNVSYSGLNHLSGLKSNFCTHYFSGMDGCQDVVEVTVSDILLVELLQPVTCLDVRALKQRSTYNSLHHHSLPEGSFSMNPA
jgi:hypothetical protein